MGRGLGGSETATTPSSLGDEVALQCYRMARVFSRAIKLAEGEAEYVKSPTDVGTGRGKAKALENEHIVSPAKVNPLDKLAMRENDKIVARYMDDREFHGAAFPMLAREIFEAIGTGMPRP